MVFKLDLRNGTLATVVLRCRFGYRTPYTFNTGSLFNEI